MNDTLFQITLLEKLILVNQYHYLWIFFGTLIEILPGTTCFLAHSSFSLFKNL